MSSHRNRFSDDDVSPGISRRVAGRLYPRFARSDSFEVQESAPSQFTEEIEQPLGLNCPLPPSRAVTKNMRDCWTTTPTVFKWFGGQRLRSGKLRNPSFD